MRLPSATAQGQSLGKVHRPITPTMFGKTGRTPVCSR